MVSCVRLFLLQCLCHKSKISAKALKPTKINKLTPYRISLARSQLWIPAIQKLGPEAEFRDLLVNQGKTGWL